MTAPLIERAGTAPLNAGPVASASESARHARTDRLVPLLVAAFVAAVCVALVGPWPVGVFLDDGIYAILGKSLATGKGYRYLNIPGHPAATHYPPGYPLLLAALWKIAPIFPDNTALFKAVNGLLLGAAAAGMVVFLRARLGFSRIAAASTSIVVTLSIPIVILAGMVLSEPLFLALLLPALMMAEKSADDGRPVTAGLAGVMVAAMTLVRSIGIVAIPAAVLILLLRRRFVSAMSFAAASVALLIPWQLWTARYASEIPRALQGSYGSYSGWLGDAWREQGVAYALAVTQKNVRELVRVLGSFLGYGAPVTFQTILGISILLFMTAGIYLLRKSAPVTSAFMVFYLLLTLVWPFTPDRFLWGACTVFGTAIAVAFRAALARPNGARDWHFAPRAIALGAAGVILLGVLHYNIRGYLSSWYDVFPRRVANDSAPLARWVVEKSQLNDVIVSERDVLIYLYTGRMSVLPGSSFAKHYLVAPTKAETVDLLRTVIETYRPRYILANSSSESADYLYHLTPPELALIDTLPSGGAVLSPIPGSGR
jgi:hypothetical protein